jgi:hypothetical protein
MTLLKFDGFEGYSDPDDAVGSGSIISTFNRDVWSFQTGRNGGKSLRYKANNVYDGYLFLNFPTIDEDYSGIIGFAVKWNHHIENMDYPNAFFKFGYSGAYDYFRIESYLNGNISFGVYADGGSWKSPETYHVNADEWYYIEVKFRIHDTLGVGQMRINEQLVYSYSGDSLTATNVFPPYDISYCQFGLPGNYQETLYSMELDDIYIADTSGSENNDFLGDIRIDTIHPNGAGNYTQLTPSTGSNYQCVDEVAIDESDYVEGANAGDKDSYSYQSVPTDIDDSGIIGLQIRNFGQRTATADNIKIDPFIRISTTDYSQTAQDLPDSFGEVRGDIVLDDPSDSNPWTQAKINACEFGVEVG